MKKILMSIIIGAAILFNTSIATAETLNTSSVFDNAKLNSGIVTISYDTNTNSKLKVLVEKSGSKVSYNLKCDGTAENFPLQMGNGQYKVSVLENISGSKYKYVSTQNVNLDLSNANQVFLGSVQNVNWNSDMAAIKMAAELTKDLDSDTQKINAIYNYLVSNVTYDYDKLKKLEYNYLPDIDSTLSTGKGICYDFASTFAAMLRSQGIPAKLVKGYSTNVTGYHAWNEVYNSKTGEWIIADLSYDSQMKAAETKYNMEKSAAKYKKVYEY